MNDTAEIKIVGVQRSLFPQVPGEANVLADRVCKRWNTQYLFVILWCCMCVIFVSHSPSSSGLFLHSLTFTHFSSLIEKQSHFLGFNVHRYSSHTDSTMYL